MSDSTSYVVGHYCAPNDKNGNPRRVFVLYRVADGYGHQVAACDEGYGGDDADRILREFRHVEGAERAAFLPRVKVSAMEYRAFLCVVPAAPTRLDERD